MCSKPLLEEIKRRRLVTSDGDTPCTTLTIRNEDITCLAIDTNKTSEAFGGIGGLRSSGLIHGVNDSTIIIESSTINELSLVI